MEADLVYGSWTTTGLVERRGKNYQMYEECVCACGYKKYVHRGHLRSGISTNCGCKTGRAPRVDAGNTYKATFLVKDGRTRYATGDHTAKQPWGSLWNATQFTSREEAKSWADNRVQHRQQQGLCTGNYKVIEFGARQ